MKEIDNQFIINYTPVLNKIAKRFTSNKWDFEDCRQELYLKLLECLEIYDLNKKVPLEVFVKICCTKKAISFVKKMNQYRCIVWLDDDDDLETQEEKFYSFNLDNEIGDLYEYFIEKYKLHTGGILAKQKYIEGYTTKELADKNNVSTRTIDKKIKKFNRWFKKEIENKE